MTVAKIPALLLLLFMVPFAMIGVRTGAEAIGPLVEWFGMRGWTEVPAEILSADLDVHPLNEGGLLFRSRARYRYGFSGAAYEGTRVSLIEEADGIGAYQQTTHLRLRAARDAGPRLPCYVNPGNPAESILIRDIRWGLTAFLLLFALSFAGPGLVIGIGAALHLAGRPISLDPLKRFGESLMPGSRRPDRA